MLAGGFARLVRAELADKEETAITGLVVAQMQALLEERSCPVDWQRLAIHEDRRERADGVEGNRRPVVDIVVERATRGPRPRFHFEAKRLHRGDSVSAYVGPEGMGCFLSGKYAADLPDGGMLGYVQTSTPAGWARKLGAKLRKGGVAWQQEAAAHLNIPDAYGSKHNRAGRDFHIYHVLITCC